MVSMASEECTSRKVPQEASTLAASTTTMAAPSRDSPFPVSGSLTTPPPTPRAPSLGTISNGNEAFSQWSAMMGATSDSMKARTR